MRDLGHPPPAVRAAPLVAITLVVSVAGATTHRRARAQAAMPEPDPLAEAERELDVAEEALDAGDCVGICRALGSMIRAAERICALDEPGSASPSARCAAARARVAEAIARVRRACPQCDPSPPAAPARTETSAGADRVLAEPLSARASSEEARRVAVTFDPLALLAPASVFVMRAEVPIVGPTSFVATGGFGAVEVGEGRRAAWIAGAELRAGLPITASIRLFAGIDATVRGDGGRDHPLFPAGFAIGPTLGVQAIVGRGFVIEARGGAAAVLSAGSERSPIAPIASTGLGWAF